MKVTLEPDDERKAWLITFFSSFRAVEKFADKAVGGNFHPEISSFSLYHTNFAVALFKLDKKTNTVTWSAGALKDIGTSIGEVSKELSKH